MARADTQKVPTVHTYRGAKRAREARDALGLGQGGPLPDLLQAVEERGGVHVVALDLGEGVAGAHVARPGCPLLFVNARQPLPRQRFTLAHEFGHHRLRHATAVDRPSALTDSHNPLEVEANAFAAEFLLPKRALERWDDARSPGTITLEHVVRIAAVCGVSAQMVRYRLATAGVLDDERRIEQLDGEIAEDHHRRLADDLGVNTLADGLAAAQGHLPRIPAALRAGPLGALLAGELDAEGLAARIGREPAAVQAMLANLGLDTVLAA
jgi:Zn-dependent peptidase ImmA (M78 family)